MVIFCICNLSAELTPELFILCPAFSVLFCLKRKFWSLKNEGHEGHKGNGQVEVSCSDL